MAKGFCDICGEHSFELEHHHVFHGIGRRDLSEQYGAVAMLCPCCHREGPDAVHKSGATRLALQMSTQYRVMQEKGWSLDQWRAVFDKSYLDEDDIEQMDEARKAAQSGFFCVTDDELDLVW